MVSVATQYMTRSSWHSSIFLVKWRCYLERQEEFTALTDHKSLIYFKTQANLSCRQACWMVYLSRFNINIQYKPGKELVTTDALSQLYVCAAHRTTGLDPDWPLLIMQNKDKGYPVGTNSITQETVAKNEHLFVDLYGTLNRKLSNGSLVP
jgi:hypothetical protein